MKKIHGFSDTIAWYNSNAAQYADAISGLVSEDEVNEFVGNFPKKGRILDAGCGPGRDSAEFAKRGYEVTGVDISAGLLEEACKRYPEITFVEEDFRSLPFEDSVFDGVWAHASLVHLETKADVVKSLAEFYRVLHPGGVLHVLVKAQTGENKTAVVTDKLSGHDRFFQYFTENEIREYLEATGFTVLKLEQYCEADKNPEGRAEVEWILGLGRK